MHAICFVRDTAGDGESVSEHDWPPTTAWMGDLWDASVRSTLSSEDEQGS